MFGGDNVIHGPPQCLTGLAHLVVPRAFHAITAPAFPKDTTTWTKRNGVTETVVGTAIAIPATQGRG